MNGLQPGAVVADKYRILRRIAAGGMATIYEAELLDATDKVALKIPHDSFRQDRAAMKRFLREARAAMAVDSPHVVKTLAVGRLATGMPFLAMEYVDGVPLRDLMYDPEVEPQPLSLQTTLVLLDQIASAVIAAHAVHVIHRDLKPDNVLVSFGQEGVIAKVFDFGLSLVSAELSISRLTAPGTTFGTPQYMPPEQARNAGAADERADIYALGVMAYEMLSAKFPFEGETVLEVWRSATRGKPVPLSQHRPDIPTSFVDVVMRALSRDPAERQPNARVFRAEIAPFLPPPGTPLPFPADLPASAPKLPKSPPPPVSPPETAPARAPTPIPPPASERVSAPPAARPSTPQPAPQHHPRPSNPIPRSLAIAAGAVLTLAVVAILVLLALSPR